MIGTEEQARRGWWCPMARMTVHLRPHEDAAIVANRSRHDDPICMCLASACALWRWADGEYEYTMETPPPGDGWEPQKSRGGAWQRLRVVRNGYCGLAPVRL